MLGLIIETIFIWMRSTLTDLNAPSVASLKHYLSIPNPQFAILLSAPWGAGKTRLVKTLFKEQKSEQHLHISLFGVANRTDIDRAIVRAFYPKSENDLAIVAKQIAKVVDGGLFSKLSSIDLTEFVYSRLPETLIFDDIERTQMKIQEVLGAINGFVEHQGKHVIILANEDVFWGEEGQKEKEKVIGKTLSVVADIASALDNFISDFKDNYNEFLKRETGTITDMFRRANYHNLRSLKQVLWDFSAIYEILEAQLIENVSGMKELFSVYLALALELKSGNFNRDDMRLRGEIDFETKEKFKKLREARFKYDLEHVQYGRHGSVLPYELAEKVLIDGFLEGNEINSILSQANAFLEKSTEEEWQTVWWAAHRNEADVKLAVEKMEKKFEIYKYIDPATILHVFACRLDLKKRGLGEKDHNITEAECVKYIDELMRQDLLKGFDPVADFNNSSGFGYSRNSGLHLGYPTGEDDEKVPIFDRLFEKMHKSQKAVFERSFRQKAEEFTALMSTDVELFRQKISRTNSGENVFASIPIFASMSAKAFADALMKCNVADRNAAFDAISNRYKSPDKELKKESEWLTELHSEVILRIRSESKFLQWQTKLFLQHSIGEVLDSWKEDKNDA